MATYTGIGTRGDRFKNLETWSQYATHNLHFVPAFLFFLPAFVACGTLIRPFGSNSDNSPLNLSLNFTLALGVVNVVVASGFVPLWQRFVLQNCCDKPSEDSNQQADSSGEPSRVEKPTWWALFKNSGRVSAEFTSFTALSFASNLLFNDHGLSTPFYRAAAFFVAAEAHLMVREIFDRARIACAKNSQHLPLLENDIGIMDSDAAYHIQQFIAHSATALLLAACFYVSYQYISDDLAHHINFGEKNVDHAAAVSIMTAIPMWLFVRGIGVQMQLEKLAKAAAECMGAAVGSAPATLPAAGQTV